MKRIPLHSLHGVIAHALVDDADAESVGETRWYLSPNGYAHAPKCGEIYMHRVVAGIKRGDGRVVHHDNRDKLDNRRANLVVCADQREGRLQHTNWKLRLYSFEELRAMAREAAA